MRYDRHRSFVLSIRYSSKSEILDAIGSLEDPRNLGDDDHADETGIFRR